MTDEEKLMWIFAYTSKSWRGEISLDCATFADKARQDYVDRFGVDAASNDDYDWQKDDGAA